MIEAEKGFEGLNASSKMNAECAFLQHLFEVGRQVAEDWLETHFDAIGRRSSLDLYGLLH